MLYSIWLWMWLIKFSFFQSVFKKIKWEWSEKCSLVIVVRIPILLLWEQKNIYIAALFFPAKHAIFGKVFCSPFLSTTSLQLTHTLNPITIGLWFQFKAWEHRNPQIKTDHFWKAFKTEPTSLIRSVWHISLAAICRSVCYFPELQSRPVLRVENTRLYLYGLWIY